MCRLNVIKREDSFRTSDSVLLSESIYSATKWLSYSWINDSYKLVLFRELKTYSTNSVVQFAKRLMIICRFYLVYQKHTAWQCNLILQQMTLMNRLLLLLFFFTVVWNPATWIIQKSEVFFLLLKKKSSIGYCTNNRT